MLTIVPPVTQPGLEVVSGLGPTRRALAIGLRGISLSLLAAALSGSGWVRRTDNRTVVFALDQSGHVHQSGGVSASADSLIGW